MLLNLENLNEPIFRGPVEAGTRPAVGERLTIPVEFSNERFQPESVAIRAPRRERVIDITPERTEAQRAWDEIRMINADSEMTAMLRHLFSLGIVGTALGGLAFVVKGGIEILSAVEVAEVPAALLYAFTHGIPVLLSDPTLTLPVLAVLSLAALGILHIARKTGEGIGSGIRDTFDSASDGLARIFG